MTTPTTGISSKSNTDHYQSQDTGYPSKKLRFTTDADRSSSRIGKSLLCTDETLDDFDDLPVAGAGALMPSSEMNFPSLISLPKKLRPPFADRLIVNVLDEIRNVHLKQWQKLGKESLPDFFIPSISIIQRALKDTEPAPSRLSAFEAGVRTFVTLCGDEKKYAGIRKTALKMVSTFFVGINALKIHLDVLDYYTPGYTKPNKSDLEELLSGVPTFYRPPIITELANLWVISHQVSGNLNEYIPPNLPNQLFEVGIDGSGHQISFFRMQSPETTSQELSPMYELFLDHHQNNSSRHLSLITLSPSIFVGEQKIAGQRYSAQTSRPNSLVAWAFEPDSDFAAQDTEDGKEEAIGPFMEELDKEILNKNASSFSIPEHIRKNAKFQQSVEHTIMEVHKILFPTKEVLSPDEKRDFTLMTVVLLMEQFCEKFEPSTVDTACRSHIDRGIMVSSVLYVYLMIKSGSSLNHGFLEYLKPLILAPALTVAQRPPHSDKMKAMLSLITRMLHPNVVKKLQESKTYFSSCKLDIPKATL